MHFVNEQNLRARANLALRAERAFGLNVLPIALSEPAPPAKVTSPVPPPMRAAPLPPAPPPMRVSPPPVPAPRAERPAAAQRATQVQLPPVDLFGGRAAPATSPFPSNPFTAPPLTLPEKVAQLRVLNENEVSVCRKCRLCETRTNTVFGEGDPGAKILFIGEGPGENEDLQGRPFVGRAGDLLNKWIAAMGLKREQVFIANIVKCRPPGNREPAIDETQACTPFLLKQIEIIRPEVIITLGKPSSQYMLQTKNSMGSMRGVWHEWRGIHLLPTYHPAYVLRSYNYQTRSAVWSDLQKVMAHLGLPLPKRAPSE